MCTQSLQLMHALSTERKGNTGSDVNNFPIEGPGQSLGFSPPFQRIQDTIECL